MTDAPLAYAVEVHNGSTALYDHPRRGWDDYIATVFRPMAEGELYDEYQVTWAKTEEQRSAA